MSGDSQELEALFDSIAYAAAPTAPAAPASGQRSDTPELESLFDSITAAMTQGEAPTEGASAAVSESVFAKVGQMTRGLHNLLRELGYDTALERFAEELPNNRDRLNYIAAMTAQAAEKTLNAAEAAQPMATQLGGTAGELAGKWDLLFARQLGVVEFKALVTDTHAFLKTAPLKSEAINAQLMEIIMAQDFQDLTGQVIKKILDAAQKLEKELVALLVETTPEGKRQTVPPELLGGPVINAAGRTDVVSSQEQVDELLDSLGF